MSSATASRVDAHQHYWRIRRGDYRWITPQLAPLARDFLPADLAPELARAGIAHTVLVQAADTVAETRFLLELASREPSVLGVVGWCELDSPQAPRQLIELASAPALVGLRPMLQDLPDPRWVLRPAVLEHLRLLPGLGLAFDALVTPRELAALPALLEHVPGLALVVDHGGKPCIPARGSRWDGFDAWRDAHRRIAAHPRAHCKLSGLVTELAPGLALDDARDGLQRVVDTLLELYGARRCLWGSDWPVSTLRASYAQWLELSRRLLASLSPDEQAGVFGANARSFYSPVRTRDGHSLPEGSLA